MNLGVTALTRNIMNEVGALIVFRSLGLMTSVTSGGLPVFLSSYLYMLLNIRDVQMAAGTGIGPVGGFCKFLAIDAFVTFKTLGILDKNPSMARPSQREGKEEQDQDCQNGVTRVLMSHAMVSMCPAQRKTPR
jgi:hypothetical protein